MLDQSDSDSWTNPSTASDIALSPMRVPVEMKHTVMSLKNVRFAWDSALYTGDGINLEVESCSAGTLVLVIGPVGSGKSTILKGLAGETPVIEGDYFIKYPDIAFCDQTPWLVNASIKENIVGGPISEVDREWYRTVINACSLDADFAKMPEGDQTLVGSQGAKLSGGQRQRIVSMNYGTYANKQVE